MNEESNSTAADNFTIYGSKLPMETFPSPLHVHVILGHCYVAIVILLTCLWMLNRRPFSRYRLSCLLIIRWNCVADLACLLNKACFALLDRPELWQGASRHVAAWVCKLYHFGDNVTLTLQVWVLTLFAMERAAMCLRLRFALKHFNAFRLKIGAIVAGVVGLAAHLNYLWMFSIVAGVSRLSNRNSINSDDSPGEAQMVEVICSVLPEFHSVYSVAVVLEVFLNVYAPISICAGCSLAVLYGWLCGRAEKLSPNGGSIGGSGGSGGSGGNGSQNPQRYYHHASLARSAGTSSRPTNNGHSSFQSAELVNISSRILFLTLTILCYPPLAVTGIFKAQTVHSRSELSQSLYPILYYIVQPTKNILSALAHCVFVVYLLLAHRNSSCRGINKSQSVPSTTDRVDNSDRLNGPNEDRVSELNEQQEEIPLNALESV